MVCQNQSIDDSDAPLAKDLRVLVRERLSAGDSDSQVIDFLVARYGEFVLLKPRETAHTLGSGFSPFAVPSSAHRILSPPPPARHRRRLGAPSRRRGALRLLDNSRRTPARVVRASLIFLPRNGSPFQTHPFARRHERGLSISARFSFRNRACRSPISAITASVPFIRVASHVSCPPPMTGPSSVRSLAVL